MTESAAPSTTTSDTASNAGSGASQAICNCPICRAARAAAAAGKTLSDYLFQFDTELLSPQAAPLSTTDTTTTSASTTDTSATSQSAPQTVTGESPTAQGNGTSVSPYSLSGNGSTGFDEILNGDYKWGGTYGSVMAPVGTGATVTYSFGLSSNDYAPGYTEADSSLFAPFSASQQAAAQAALQLWADVANINFVQVADTSTSVGQIRFALTDPSLTGGTAYTYYPWPYYTGGDVWFSNNSTFINMTPGNYAFMSLVHEIGHALGLAHPQDGPVVGDSSIDWQGMTVMSYKSAQGQTFNGVGQSLYVSGPMYEDIGAVQYLYGANTSYNSGATVYSWANGQSILQTIWDSGGNDTIDCSNQSSACTINLQSGVWSDIGPGYYISATGITEHRTVMIADGAVIEDADGGAGDDIINGNDVNNVLVGNAGNDTLNGEGGRNTAVYSGLRANYSITRDGNATTITDNVGTDGTDTLSNIQALRFSDATVSLGSTSNDFNGDGTSDLFWQNSNGALALWEQDGTSYIGGGVFSGAGGNWNIVGQADFNGDGKNDILWQDSTNGSLGEWQMDGTSYVGGGVFSGPAAGWTLAKIADFNGDGIADLLWQDGNTYAEWQLNGTSYVGGGVFSGPGTGWTLKAAADFNGDGKSDLLWDNGAGSLGLWEMDGTSYIGGGVFSAASAGWTLKGVADFNGDGKADLLWQNGSALGEWYMDGTNYTGGGVFSAPDSSWSLAALGDYNKDGKTDLLWQNTNNGAVAEWQMDGTSYIGGGVFTTKPSGWNLVPNSAQMIA